MKYILILLFIIPLQASTFWTLSGLDKSRVYVKNETESLNQNIVDKIYAKTYSMLKKNNIAIDVRDSPTLIVFIEEIKNTSKHYIYVKLSLGEEVQTFRKTKDATFSLTYDAHDFIEVDSSELELEVLESVDFLLSQFNEQYKEDN